MSDNHGPEPKKGHFFNGFLWGAALGGGMAYLLSTKRGRDLLKDLIEDGIDLLEGAALPKDEEEFSPAAQDIVIEESPVIVSPSEAAAASSDMPGEVKKAAPSPKKHFFRARKK